MTEQQNAMANERYGWFIVVVAGIIAGMGFGSLLSVTVFLQPLETEFGWLRADTSFAYMVGNVTAGVGGIFMGSWADKYGTRVVVLGGTVMLSLSFILLGMLQSLAEFYVFYGLILCGMAMSAYMVPLMTCVGFWFRKNRGLAISLAMGGQSLGAAIVPFSAGILIIDYGWRNAYLLLAVIAWVLLIPLCFLIRDAPGLKELKAQIRVQGSQAAAGSHPMRPKKLVFVLSLATQGCCICMTMPLVHLVPLTRDLGFDPQSGASVLSVLMVSSFVGRLLFGKMLDTIGGTRTLFVSSALQTVSVFWFTQAASLPMLYGFAAIFGLGFGGVFPAYTVIVNEMIPAHIAGRSLGIVFFAAFLAMGFGGYLGGWLYDLTGSYVVSFGVAAAAGVVNLIIVAGLVLYVNRHPSRADLLQAA